MTVELDMLLPIIIYALLIILIIVCIVFIVRLMKTLDKVDKVIDDIQQKSNKLNGLFSIVDNTTDAIVGFTNNFVNTIGNGVNHLFSKKKKKKGEKEDE